MRGAQIGFRGVKALAAAVRRCQPCARVAVVQQVGIQCPVIGQLAVPANDEVQLAAGMRFRCELHTGAGHSRIHPAVASHTETGLYGGVFNVFSNVASIVTPLVIGYLVSELYSFNAALVFAGCSALMAMVCYLFVVGDIKRMELQK